MNILSRYVGKAVLAASALVIVVVLALILVINFLGELRDIGVGEYGVAQAFVYVLLRMPHNLYEFFPVIVMLGSILGLGVLASHRELIIVRASGVSVPRIAAAVVGAALVLIAVITVVGECVAPQANFAAENYKDSLENGGQTVTTASGRWMHEGNNFLHIHRIVGRNHLEGVVRYEFDGQHRLLASYYSKTIDSRNGQWIAPDMVKTVLNGDEAHSTHVKNAKWNLALNVNLLSVGLIAPVSMSLRALADQVHYLKQNGLQAGDFQLEYWKRIFQPLTAIVMMLLAIPFVFGFSRSVTMGWRVSFGIFVGFAFYILNAFLGQFSIVFELPPVFAAIFPTLLFAVFGAVVMVRTR